MVRELVFDLTSRLGAFNPRNNYIKENIYDDVGNLPNDAFIISVTNVEMVNIQ